MSRDENYTISLFEEDYENAEEESLEDVVSNYFGIDKETSNKLIDNDKSELLIDDLKALEEKNEGGGFKDTVGMPIDEFVEEYFDRESRYCNEYMISKGERVEDEDYIERARKKAYRNAHELLGKIVQGKRRIELPDDMEDLEKVINSKNPIDYLEMKGRIENLDMKAGELFKKGRVEEGKDVVKRKEEIKKEIKDFERREVVSAVEKYEIDSSDESYEEMERCLDDIKSYVGGDTLKEVEDKIQKLDTDGYNSIGNVLKTEIWSKNLDDMPTYRDTQCCAFLTGRNDRTVNQSAGIFKYMARDDIDLMKFNVGKDREAWAIMGYGDRYGKTEEEDKKNILLVDSVESKNLPLNRKDVSETIKKSIEDYAESKGVSEIFYPAIGVSRNTAPEQFLENIKEDDSYEFVRNEDPFKLKEEGNPREKSLYEEDLGAEINRYDFESKGRSSMGYRKKL